MSVFLGNSPDTTVELNEFADRDANRDTADGYRILPDHQDHPSLRQLKNLTDFRGRL